MLGGDCTVVIGTVIGQIDAGLGTGQGEGTVGLLYFDTHADLNIPESVSEGALDWMGMAHLLGVPGARPELVEAGPIAPLLAPGQVVLFGWGPEQATAFEREQIERRGEGLTFEIALTALAALLATPKLAALTITELNPEHTEPDAGAIRRLVEALAAALTWRG